jgi:hypothetical protein
VSLLEGVPADGTDSRDAILEKALGTPTWRLA